MTYSQQASVHLVLLRSWSPRMHCVDLSQEVAKDTTSFQKFGTSLSRIAARFFFTVTITIQKNKNPYMTWGDIISRPSKFLVCNGESGAPTGSWQLSVHFAPCLLARFSCWLFLGVFCFHVRKPNTSVARALMTSSPIICSFLAPKMWNALTCNPGIRDWLIGERWWKNFWLIFLIE